MFKKIVSTVILVMVIFSVSGAFGQNPGGKGMAWRLDLSKEQKDKIGAQESTMRKDTLQLRQTIRDLRNQLNAELSADNPDKTKVNGLIDSISKNMTEIQKQEMSFMLWMREQLTPEQKQKLLTLLKNRQEMGAGSQEGN